ncbi:cell wall hydrolase [Sphingomonas caeni]|uniref:cell wall hydrolase n=1 Tax=Sphingomonas caeni TaxID=2984949 RepID=UPI00222EBB6D|nr:cell wall hydrolase [Sphingomonas caeni]
MQARGLAAAAIASLIGAGFSAQALAPSTGAVAVKVEKRGYEADDHFPGALYETAVDDNAAMAAGMTGTAELPDMPIPAGAADGVSDSSIQPAKPFLETGSSVDRARALQCLTTAIYYEAATEPDEGQRAVAQVILNRVRHPAFPNTVCGVVYQGSERRGCQFSFACDGSMARAPSRQYWARAEKVAEAALSGNVFAPVGLATHYHTYAVTPSWNRSLVMTGTWGAHFFHRWKGYWGTAAAFSQAYRGHEPLPAPHARAEPAATTPATAPAAMPRPAQTPSELIQPRYADSGTPTAQAPRAVAAPAPSNPKMGDESQIVDRWRDSGKPLR